ncbi:tetratricopeptide repeat protein [Pseudobythopirellula maris]|uniref:Tetratricopeptide repeat protein n=1 Tax=Pseudobythopirellula maris TaxID=2527991 RepID=A0A5C5ZWM2_9BACT|nr:tetratricopeptide repeat protein [Pseudobythopirellula maris]TWT90673.1 tetratricopeptide repeat protein [Pseudobythopirellula maris]
MVRYKSAALAAAMTFSACYADAAPATMVSRPRVGSATSRPVATEAAPETKRANLPWLSKWFGKSEPTVAVPQPQLQPRAMSQQPTPQQAATQQAMAQRPAPQPAPPYGQPVYGAPAPNQLGYASPMPGSPVGPRGGMNPAVFPASAFQAAMATQSPSSQRPAAQPTPASETDRVVESSRNAEAQGNTDLARGLLKQALAETPLDVALLRELGRVEDRAGNLESAEGFYQQAATEAPQHAGVLNDLGLCQARQGKLDESLETFQRAIRLNPEKGLYRNNVATVLTELGRNDEALAHLKTFHAAPAAHFNLGQMLASRGREIEAAEQYFAALELDPSMAPAHVAMEKLSPEALAAAAPTTAPAQVEPQPQLADTALPKTPPQQAAQPWPAPHQQAHTQQPFTQPAPPRFTSGQKPLAVTPEMTLPIEGPAQSGAPTEPNYQTAIHSANYGPRLLPAVRDR